MDTQRAPEACTGSRRRRIALLTLGLLAIVLALLATGFPRWIGELPTYPACAAALQRIAAARTAAEVEQAMTRAKAAGAWIEHPGIDVALDPGEVVAPGTVRVGCQRFEPDSWLAEPTSRLESWRVGALYVRRYAGAGVGDYTVVEVVVQERAVRVLRFEDCRFGCVDCLDCRAYGGSGDWTPR